MEESGSSISISWIFTDTHHAVNGHASTAHFGTEQVGGQTGERREAAGFRPGDRVLISCTESGGTTAVAVQILGVGPSDTIREPISPRDLLSRDLLSRVELALERSRERGAPPGPRDKAAVGLARLTARQRQILDLVLAGRASKTIAADLGISQRTVENHRASVMKKSGAKSIAGLARLALSAGWMGLVLDDERAPSAMRRGGSLTVWRSRGTPVPVSQTSPPLRAGCLAATR